MDIRSKQEFREWLEANHDLAQVCYLSLKRGRPAEDGEFYYLDAVEVALCYGWIDSTLTTIDGRRMQKMTPRRKNSLWSELNKERVRRLERLGLMTDAGRRGLPDMTITPVVLPADVKEALVLANALSNFENFPELYKRIRIYNLNFYRTKLPKDYPKALQNFVKHTAQNKTYGEWNDYGRLTVYLDD